jgi:hypothetical protein
MSGPKDFENTSTEALKAMASTREAMATAPKRAVNEALLSDREFKKLRQQLASSAEAMRAEVRRRSQTTDSSN